MLVYIYSWSVRTADVLIDGMMLLWAQDLHVKSIVTKKHTRCTLYSTLYTIHATSNSFVHIQLFCAFSINLWVCGNRVRHINSHKYTTLTQLSMNTKADKWSESIRPSVHSTYHKSHHIINCLLLFVLSGSTTAFRPRAHQIWRRYITFIAHTRNTLKLRIKLK